MSSQETCKTCKWWNNFHTTYPIQAWTPEGRCLRGNHVVKGSTSPHWPDTGPDDFCAEHEPKTED